MFEVCERFGKTMWEPYHSVTEITMCSPVPVAFHTQSVVAIGQDNLVVHLHANTAFFFSLNINFR